MGLVYRARQRRPDRLVAIKLIAPELAADPAFRARFEQESNTAAQIEHPNVIPVYEVGEDSGLLYIAMRYIDGVDLGGLLASSGPLTPERAARFVSQVADALDAAHARGLVHRDVKPGNILVAAGDHVYLTDFGLTKRMTDTRGPTATGMFVGTVDYIAPEQIEGRRIDARADVYALGCVVYQMLSGRVPFPRDSELAKLYAHVNDAPPPLEGVPAPLTAAVMRAMAKRPADRFLSAGDFGRAVLAGAAGRADHATGRAVATRGASIADEQSPTEAGPRTPTELVQTRPTPPADATATGEPRTSPRRRLPFPLVAVGAATLVAVIGAAVAIALGSGGSAPTPSISHSTRSSSSTVRTSATQNTSRATLAPATGPPSVDECQQQLTFGADGTASPVKCANGDVNVVAWRYYARVAGHILAAGAFANPGQAIQAMCKDTSSTIPIEQMAYQLAQTYYGWQFAVDPSSEYPGSCH